MPRSFRISDLAFLAGAAVGGYFATRSAARREFHKSLAELRQDFDARLDALAAQLQVRTGSAVTTPATGEPAPPKAAQKTAPAVQDEIPPEVLLVIAAAVTAFLGKKVRIRSAKVLYAHGDQNAWSQQGRVFIQASHNIAQRTR